MKASIFAEIANPESLSPLRRTALAQLLTGAFRIAGNPEKWKDIASTTPAIRDGLLRAYAAWSKNPREASVAATLIAPREAEAA